jgi:hypothetical protein
MNLNNIHSMGAVLQVVNFACFCDFVSLLPTFA